MVTSAGRKGQKRKSAADDEEEADDIDDDDKNRDRGKGSSKKNEDDDRKAQALLDKELDNLIRSAKGATADAGQMPDALKKEQDVLGSLGKDAEASSSISATASAQTVAELLRDKVNKAKGIQPKAPLEPGADVVSGMDGPVSIRGVSATIKAVAASGDDDFNLVASTVGGASAPLTSERNAFRCIAKDKPGALLTSGLDTFKEDLVHTNDHVEDDNPMQPVMVAWFRSIFSPRNRDSNDLEGREVQTYCRLLDYGLEGKLAQLMDMLMQRLKAKVFSMSEKSWTTAQHMELLPPLKTGSVLTMGKEEFVRRVSCGELRLHDLINRIQNHGASSSDGGGGKGSRR